MTSGQRHLRTLVLNAKQLAFQPYLSEKTELAKPQSIAVLNDAFRKTFTGGNVVITAGVNELPDTVKAEALQSVSRFDAFTEENDPYEEHDFGIFELQGQTLYWKIDYFDPNPRIRLGGPGDPAKTTRVLTVMLAAEY